jgi:hypothetical protein
MADHDLAIHEILGATERDKTNLDHSGRGECRKERLNNSYNTLRNSGLQSARRRKTLTKKPRLVYRGLRGEQTAQQLFLRGFTRGRLLRGGFRSATALEVSVAAAAFDHFVVLFAHRVLVTKKEILNGAIP